MHATLASTRILRSILIGSSALGLSLAAGAAYAQDKCPDGSNPPCAAGAVAAGATNVGEVVVTGSRIPRRDYTASTPIVTVNKQSFEQRANPEIEATLNQLPQFQTGIYNGVGQAAQGQPSATLSPGAAFLNLRGLGINRNLVLIDGRRPQPANATLAVDINTLPSAAIEGVEIITGGASAVYGADAIAGVVNFKLRKNFAGFELDAQYGVNQRGDGREPNISGLIGFNGDRGNAMFGVSWTQRSLIMQKDRDFFRQGWADPGTVAGFSYPFLPFPAFDCGPNAGFVGLPAFANCPTPAAVNGIFGAGVAPPGASGFSVNPNGTVFLAGRGANGVGAPRYAGPGLPGFKVQANGNLGQNGIVTPLQAPLDRWAMFGSAHYDLTDHLTAFLQGNFSETKIRTAFVASPAVQFWGASIPHDAAHPTTPELETLLNSRFNGVNVLNAQGQVVLGPGAPWALQIDLDNVTGPRRTEATTNTYQVVVGLRGDIPGADWTWEAYGSHGKTAFLNNSVGGFASTRRWQQFLALPNWGANGSISLGSLQKGTCTSGFYGAIFQGTAPTQDCIDAVSIYMKSTTELTQNVVEASIAGSLFMLPAGELKFSVGGDYREEIFAFQPDPLLDVTSTADAPIGLFPTGKTGGRVDVKELYGELLVPVLGDMPFFKKLEAELGARYSDYNTAGGQWTYKILGNWQVTDWLQLRGGYQLAARAPNVAELFQPDSPLVVGWPSGDPCAITTVAPWGNVAANPNRLKTQQLCADLIHKYDPSFNYTPGPTSNPAATANTYLGLFPFYFPLAIDTQQGNPALKPEKASTWTAGAVLRSPVQSGMFRRAQLSVDWYRIEIKDAILSVTSQVLYEQCFNADGSSNPTYTIAGNPFCAYIRREVGTGGSRTAIAPYFNFGALQTSGVDVQFDWGFDFADAGLGIPGSLTVNAVVNWLDYFKTQAQPGAVFVNYTGTVGNGGSINNQFKWKSIATFTYIQPIGSLGLRWRHFPKARAGAYATNPATTIQGVNQHDEFDLFASWKVTDMYSLRAGVDNLLDTQPEVFGINPGLNNAKGFTLFDYDQIGRRFYVGVKARW